MAYLNTAYLPIKYSKSTYINMDFTQQNSLQAYGPMKQNQSNSTC